MNRTLIVPTLLLLVPVSGVAQGHEQHKSPYVELQAREIKALSVEEVAALRAGEGMELALAAELNAYPGPRHVLELSDSLELTPEQRTRTENLMARMSEAAIGLGVRLIEAERELDRAFAERVIDLEYLTTATRTIALLRAELRAVHLAAHLQTVEILTTHQQHRYQQVRGYGVGADHH